MGLDRGNAGCRDPDPTARIRAEVAHCTRTPILAYGAGRGGAVPQKQIPVYRGGMEPNPSVQSWVEVAQGPEPKSWHTEVTRGPKTQSQHAAQHRVQPSPQTGHIPLIRPV